MARAARVLLPAALALVMATGMGSGGTGGSGGAGAGRDQDAAPARGVILNEHFIDQALSAPAFDIADIDAVFAYVFAALAPQVMVYPTENYYYFTFAHGGVIHAGNFRLDVRDRDEGVLHFAYFDKSEDWSIAGETRYKAMTAADGVLVEQAGPLRYRVTHGGKSVLFRLNDLRHVRPPEAALAPGETYLGPVFDEAGVRFYFLFSRAERRFLFVLDETGPMTDRLLPYTPDDPDILLGRRTGFAYVQDRFRARKILVGVYGGNVVLNNYFDGPFDQLPDNFFKPGEFVDAVLAVYPELEGRLDPFGSFKDRDGRVLIAPYLVYHYLNELEGLRACRAVPEEAAYYRCLLPADEAAPEPDGTPGD